LLLIVVIVVVVVVVVVVAAAAVTAVVVVIFRPSELCSESIIYGVAGNTTGMNFLELHVT
jgi:hypothetical protein